MGSLFPLLVEPQSEQAHPDRQPRPQHVPICAGRAPCSGTLKSSRAACARARFIPCAHALEFLRALQIPARAGISIPTHAGSLVPARARDDFQPMGLNPRWLEKGADLVNAYIWPPCWGVHSTPQQGSGASCRTTPWWCGNFRRGRRLVPAARPSSLPRPSSLLFFSDAVAVVSKRPPLLSFPSVTAAVVIISQLRGRRRLHHPTTRPPSPASSPNITTAAPPSLKAPDIRTCTTNYSRLQELLEDSKIQQARCTRGTRRGN
ncbi:hypothetical protein KSP40_PGU020169 [Platanthera guangdongensis]|uniref:SWIM-type domain-containing protein n=1 Tax=Platanthera guangdongensis TaxID=2320717 RepID=A0ABR2MLH6_9ASPA